MDYRRLWSPGGTYFFTINLLQRKNNKLLIQRIDEFRKAVRDVKVRHPFHIHAWVVLPEHTHCLIELPENNDDFASRIRLIKSEFSKSLPQTEYRSPIRQKRGERAIWQRRYWEHLIRDELDFQTHFDYIHYNPVKHGWVKQVKNWPYSTFHYWVDQGIYSADWGGRSSD